MIDDGIYLENLTPESVSILIVTNGSNWRCSYNNTVNERQIVIDILKDSSESLNQLLTEWGAEPTVTPTPPEPIDIENHRAMKITEINTETEQIIYAGLEIETSKGWKLFRLTQNDQANLQALYGGLVAALGGAPSPIDLTKGIWYKADGPGERHQWWSSDDIFTIVLTAFGFINETLTYADDLKAHLNTLQTNEEIAGIHYGMEIPK